MKVNNQVEGSADNDYIATSWLEDVTINGNNGDDFIEGSYRYSSLNGGNGNDTIINGSAENGISWQSYSWSYSSYAGATINGGAGDDLIQNIMTQANYGYWNDHDELVEIESQASINGGSGNDVIEIMSTAKTETGYGEWVENSDGDSDYVWHDDSLSWQLVKT